MNGHWGEGAAEEEEMHTAPHPTLGQIEATLLGSKGLFKNLEAVYEESDSMAPWACPVPTPTRALKFHRAYRSLCSSPQSVSTLPFTFPSRTPTVLTLHSTLISSQAPQRPCCRQKKGEYISSSPKFLASKRKSPVRLVANKRWKQGKKEEKPLHRPPIQLRASHLKILAVQRLDRHMDVGMSEINISHNNTLSRISDRTLSASTFAESNHCSFVNQRKLV